MNHVDDPRAAGERLRDAREAGGLSQRDLAFPGCSAAYVSRLERGERTPSLQLLRELGRRLGVSEEWLATGREGEAASLELLGAELALGLGELDEATEGFEAVLAGRPTRRDEARALAGLARVALGQHDPATALERLDLAHSLVDDDASAPGLADAVLAAALAASRVETAATIAEARLAEAQAGGDAISEVRAALVLVSILPDGPRRREAERALAGALAAAGDQVNPLALASRYRQLSREHAHAGRPEEAAEYARRALAALALREDIATIAEARATDLAGVPSPA